MKKRTKQKIILVSAVVLLLISATTFFFLLTETGKITGLSLFEQEEDFDIKDCFKLQNGKMVCKIGTFEIQASQVIENNFVFLNETE